MNHPFQRFQYCPSCGSRSFASKDDKSMQCGQCGFRYFINEAAAVVALIRNENREFLFTIRKNDPARGMLDFPGGFVDLGETAEQAVVREIKEELNLDVTTVSFFGSFPNQYLYGGLLYFTLDLVFECEVASFGSIQATDDVSDFQFMDIQKVDIDSVGLNSIKTVVAKLKQG